MRMLGDSLSLRRVGFGVRPALYKYLDYRMQVVTYPDGTRQIKNHAKTGRSKDALVVSSQNFDLGGTLGEMPVPLRVELGDELTTGVSAGANCTATSIAGGTRLDNTGVSSTAWFRLNAVSVNDISVPAVSVFTFSLVVGSIYPIITRYFNGTSHVFLDTPYQVVEGLNTVSISTYKGAAVGAYYTVEPYIDEVFTWDITDVSVKPILQVTSYVYQYDLDKKKWNCIPPEQDRDAAGTVELLENGDFSDGLTGWEIVSGTAEMTEDGVYIDPVNYVGLKQEISHAPIIGKDYSVIVAIHSIAAGSGRVYIGRDGNTGLYGNITGLGVGTHTFRFKALLTDPIVIQLATTQPSTASLTYNSVSLQQSLPIATELIIKDQKTGPIFTNDGPLSQEALDIINAKPELIVAINSGQLALNSFSLTGLWGFGEGSGPYLLDSVAGYGADLLQEAGEVTQSGCTISLNGSDGFNVTADGTGSSYRPRLDLSNLENGLTYVLELKETVNSGSCDYARLYDGVETAGVLRSAGGSYATVFTCRGDAFMSYSGDGRTFDIDVIGSLRKVSAIKAKDYLETMRTNAKLEPFGIPLIKTVRDGAGMFIEHTDNISNVKSAVSTFDTSTDLVIDGITPNYTILQILADSHQVQNFIDGTSTISKDNGPFLPVPYHYHYHDQVVELGEERQIGGYEYSGEEIINVTPDHFEIKHFIIDELWDDERRTKELTRRGLI